MNTREELERIINNGIIGLYPDDVKKIASIVIKAGFIRLEDVNIEETIARIKKNIAPISYEDKILQVCFVILEEVMKLASAIAKAKGILRIKKRGKE